MRGYFGIGVYHSKTEHNIGTLMRSAQCFGAHFIYTIGRRYRRQASDTMNATCSIPCYNYQSFDDLLNHLPDACPIVGIELTDDAYPVNTFVHPTKCCYLLGAEDHGLPPAILKRCYKTIIIPGTSRCLNVASAGSIVLYDRIRSNSLHRSINNRAA